MNDDVSAELCCGTHASNTGQLGRLCLTSFHVVGDSTFEIEGQIGQEAVKIQQRDQELLGYLEDMNKLNELATKLGDNPTLYHQKLTEIARISIQVEEIIKKSTTSYLVSHRVKEESVKYRPSKNKLQNALKRVLDQELSKEGSNMVELESVLMPDQVVSVLSKVASNRPVLAVTNLYRRQIVLFSKTGDQNALNKQQDLLQNKTGNQLKVSLTGKNFRVLGFDLKDSESVLNGLKSVY